MEGIRTKILKLDQGGEYMWREFIKFCQEVDTRQLIQAYMPQHNIIVKRKNKRLLKKTWSILLACNILTSLWTKASNTTTYLLNKCPNRTNNVMNIKEKYLRVLPWVNHLKKFGPLAYIHVLENQWMKLNPLNTRCILVGLTILEKVVDYSIFGL